MTRFYAKLATALTVCFLGALAFVVLRPSGDRFAPCRESVISGGVDSIGGPFTLVDETGTTVTDQDIITKPTLLYFGYTFCPDVCPLDNARNAQAVDLLTDRGFDVQPVFISVDPKRDTPEVMADFADLMHPKMIGLTGSEAQVKAASQAYRTYFKINTPEEEFYLVDHSTFTYLVLPKVGFVEFFRRELSAEDIAEKSACFLERM